MKFHCDQRRPEADPSPLVELVKARFPTKPVPPYPEQMGIDPFGREDEYAGFANKPWTDVSLEDLSDYGYDISPPIGFSHYDPPHMWNYYVPAFMVASPPCYLMELACQPPCWCCL